jgi:hypothetical protein
LLFANLILAALLKDKKVFFVNIEKPDNHGSTVETAIEDPQGISCFVEGNIITFKGDGKTASFAILENAQIITSQIGNDEIISTFAENGGVQIQITINK